MTHQLVYTLDDLAALPIGTVVRAHRDLSGDGKVNILARQPSGWFAAWGWEIEIDPGYVMPCTVLHRGDS
jgi:hypothetical protein